jgi:hypothetical protein
MEYKNKEHNSRTSPCNILGGKNMVASKLRLTMTNNMTNEDEQVITKSHVSHILYEMEGVENFKLRVWFFQAYTTWILQSNLLIKTKLVRKIK